MGDVTVGDGRAVQVHIANVVAIVAVDAAAEVPSVERVKADVERHAGTGVPVAIDVLRA